MTKFLKSEMSKASKTLRKSIKDGKGLPKSIKMIDSNGKTHTVEKKYYNGLFEAQNVFIRKHGRYPNYVTLNSTANNPLVMDYQNNAYNCGPTSLSMAIQMLYSYVSEQKCATACHTGSGGTDPSNLISGAKSLGYTLTPISRNYKRVKASIDKGKPVIAHVETGGNTKPACLGYVNNYGHYILIYGAINDYYYIADPTKGLKKCKPRMIDKATNGRSIHYYSVGVK